MRDCRCGSRRSRVTVGRTRRYVYDVRGEFCPQLVEALLTSMQGVRDVVIGEGRFSFQGGEGFDEKAFFQALKDLGMEVKPRGKIL